MVKRWTAFLLSALLLLAGCGHTVDPNSQSVVIARTASSARPQSDSAAAAENVPETAVPDDAPATRMEKGTKSELVKLVPKQKEIVRAIAAGGPEYRFVFGYQIAVNRTSATYTDGHVREYESGVSSPVTITIYDNEDAADKSLRGTAASSAATHIYEVYRFEDGAFVLANYLCTDGFHPVFSQEGTPNCNYIEYDGTTFAVDLQERVDGAMRDVFPEVICDTAMGRQLLHDYLYGPDSIWFGENSPSFYASAYGDGISGEKQPRDDV